MAALKRILVSTAVLLLLAPGLAPAEGAAAPERKAASLDQLLELVRKARGLESEENKRREAEFQSARNQQAQLLKRAEAQVAALERRSAELEATFDSNEKQLATLEIQMRERLGALGELLGVVRTVAADASGTVGASITSAQLPGREDFLEEIGAAKEIPTIDNLRELWFHLQQEATESGKVAKFQAPVVTTDGALETKSVVRAGVFNAVSDGAYLTWNPETQNLVELPRQPAGQHTSTITDLTSTSSGMVGFSMDPSKGQILGLLIEVPSFIERIQQGGIVGTIIMCLASFGILLSIIQFSYLFIQGQKVNAQLKKESADEGNALGRVMSVYDSNRSGAVETLELKLDEAILKETPALERFLTTVKVLSVVSPLLGLLGTVTGMIQTFQAITLFGAGDPKLMAGGISVALVTTMLGLYSAIPLVLLHSFLKGRSDKIQHVLEDQAAGMVARQAEAKHAA